MKPRYQFCPALNLSFLIYAVAWFILDGRQFLWTKMEEKNYLNSLLLYFF